MLAWEAELGASTEALEEHADLVQATIKAMIANNGDRRVHLNWDLVEKGSLRKVDTKELKVKSPGWQHYALDIEIQGGDVENLRVWKFLRLHHPLDLQYQQVSYYRKFQLI